jgi:hypothetical protein
LSSRVSDNNPHIFPRENTVRKQLLAALFNPAKKGVIVIRIMVSQYKLFDPREPGAFDGLLVAGMAPTTAIG